VLLFATAAGSLSAHSLMISSVVSDLVLRWVSADLLRVFVQIMTDNSNGLKQAEAEFQSTNCPIDVLTRLN
jgi:hypothetical protein